MFDGITSKFARKAKVPKIPLGFTPYADLMPRRARAKQEVHDLKGLWIKIGALLVVLVGLAFVGALGFRLQASDGYNEQVEVQQNLAQSLSNLAEANNVLSSITLLETKQSEALGTETAWAKVLSNINSVLPSGASIKSLSAVSGGTPAVEGSVGLAATVQISSNKPIAYSEVLAAISRAEGLKDIQVGDLIRGGEGASGSSSYDYTVAFSLDDQVFTKRYLPQPEGASETATPPAGEN